MNRKTIKMLAAAFCATSLTIQPMGLGHAAAAAASSHAEQRPAYKSRQEIPAQYKWRLDQIYKDKASWEQDRMKAEKLARAFAANQGKLAASPNDMKKGIDELAALSRLRDKLALYAHAGLDVNISNAQLQDLYDKASRLSTLIGEKTAWFSPEIVAIPDDKMAKLLESKELAPYKRFLEDVRRTKPYTLSKEMEQLLAASAPLADLPDNAYGMLSKDIPLPKIKDEKGKDVQLSRANYVTYIENRNQAMRKTAFTAYYNTLGNFQDTFAQLLSGKVKADNYYARVHHFKTALEASLYPNEIPVPVYDNLIRTVDDNLALLHRYMVDKKKLLGLKDMHMYDLYVPVGANKQRYIPYEEAKARVLAGLKVMGNDYVKVLKEAFDNGWIDVYSTNDKRTGAYQTGAYDTHPYLLLNYQGTDGDVSTIAHELGHAMQSYYSNKKQPYLTAGYPIFTAEVASTLNEHLLFKSEYAKAKTKEEKLYFLNRYLENFRNTLFRQTQFAEFEKMIHEKELAGESLNAETLKKMYLALNKKYYGPSVISDPQIAMEWSRIPHLYYDYYVYQYATSFAASAALADQIDKQGANAVERIKSKFLEAGSSAPPLTILKAAGVDMSTPQPIENAMKQFKSALAEFEKLSAEK
ncbi:oligoendopeptidase F [Aneurinibacillus sp. Ricciae_BoGa-3]|uniref:oligoendopeptidase F n=1 Tax=Aneurinibacillus sp. Ricciae_BoGa-3 TaxID=3022697 RepID=UPI002340C43D|nr:oligoendopeptidase F [Aneurinibacillus sp. Ricciae_BoGa-3]WCK52712.1 oligoendopeptidase F [Aneurinibacillus sp. Ricciae_BoGa-3]